MYVTQQAREEFDVEANAGRFYSLPRVTLTEAALARQPNVIERITMLHRVGYNTTITGPYKVGKTTFSGNLVRSLVDGDTFLDRFAVVPPTGRVGFLNYELDEQDFLEWLDAIGIRKTDQVAPLNLRGRPFTLADPRYQDEFVAWARDMAVEVLFLDPFRRAFMGFGEENSNDDVNRFTATVDELKVRADIRDVFLTVHTGRVQHAAGEERGRGATALDDWADQRWVLTKDAQQQRFMYSDERLAYVPEFQLVYDLATRRLTAEDGNRSDAAADKTLAQVVALLTASPGMKRGDIETALGSRKDKSLSRAIGQGLEDGALRVLQRGKAKFHFRFEDYPQQPDAWQPTS